MHENIVLMSGCRVLSCLCVNKEVNETEILRTASILDNMKTKTCNFHLLLRKKLIYLHNFIR